jgi:death on curing protein
MSRAFPWIGVADALRLHARQIEEFGGAKGIRDEGLPESALARPVNANAYGVEDVHELAALYAAGIIKNHRFVDGKKRTGYVACLSFSLLCGWRVVVPQAERLAMTIALASGEMDETAFAAWLRVMRRSRLTPRFRATSPRAAWRTGSR